MIIAHAPVPFFSQLVHPNPKDGEDYVLANIPFAQYVKADFDFADKACRTCYIYRNLCSSLCVCLLEIFFRPCARHLYSLVGKHRIGGRSCRLAAGLKKVSVHFCSCFFTIRFVRQN